ncbi:MAG: hypothetical protein IT285_12795 [Bdellovibrionales bacterium]|nr:hypothetical protein [Bdellovibrionales bacterium]
MKLEQWIHRWTRQAAFPVYPCLREAALGAGTPASISLSAEGDALEALAHFFPHDPTPLLRRVLEIAGADLPPTTELQARLTRHPLSGAARLELRSPCEDAARAEGVRNIVGEVGATVEWTAQPGKGCRLRITFPAPDRRGSGVA